MSLERTLQFKVVSEFSFTCSKITKVISNSNINFFFPSEKISLSVITQAIKKQKNEKIHILYWGRKRKNGFQCKLLIFSLGIKVGKMIGCKEKSQVLYLRQMASYTRNIKFSHLNEITVTKPENFYIDPLVPLQNFFSY